MEPSLPPEIEFAVFEYLRGGDNLTNLALTCHYFAKTIRFFSDDRHDTFVIKIVEPLKNGGWSMFSRSELANLNWSSWSKSKQVLCKVVVYDSPYTYCKQLGAKALAVLNMLNGSVAEIDDETDWEQVLRDMKITPSSWMNRLWLGPPPMDIFSNTFLTDMTIVDVTAVDNKTTIILNPKNAMTSLGMATIEICNFPNQSIEITEYDSKFGDPPSMILTNIEEIMCIPPWIFSIWYKIVDKPRVKK